MMTALLASLFLVGTFLVGWILTTSLGLTSRLEKTGVAFVIGSWLITLEMMVAYQFLGQFSSAITGSLVITSLVVTLAATKLIKRWSVLVSDLEWLKRVIRSAPQAGTYIEQQFRSLSRLERVLLAFVIGFLAYSVLSNLTWPVSDWDAIALYDFRALLIKLVGHWRDGKPLGYFYQYPPYTSLLHGALYQLGFESVKIVYTILYASFTVLFYAFLRTKTTRVQSILGIFLLSTAPLLWHHIIIAYTNMPYTVYVCSAILYGWRWLEKQQLADMRVSFLFLSGAVWIRQSEPFWLVVLALLLLGTLFSKAKTRWQEFLGFTLLFILFFRYWPWYTQSLNLPPPPVILDDAANGRVAISLASLTRNFFVVTDYFLSNVLKPLQTLLVPFILMIWIDPQVKKSRPIQLAVVTVGIMLALVYLGTFYFSFTYKTWNQIGDSLTRLVMVLVPLMVFCLSLSSLWKEILARQIHQKRKS